VAIVDTRIRFLLALTLSEGVTGGYTPGRRGRTSKGSLPKEPGEQRIRRAAVRQAGNPFS